MKRVGVVGGGWAGLSAAVHAQRAGAQVTVFEASRQWGGRARRLPTEREAKRHCGATLDNGQHILIGAYADTLTLMQELGADPASHLVQLPFGLPHADGSGLVPHPLFQRLPAPLNVLLTVATARGWRWKDRWALISFVWRCRVRGFAAPRGSTVGDLAFGLPQRIREQFIDPLCVSALNTPADQACAQVFLRVLKDAMMGAGWGAYQASDLLLPRGDLGRLLPDPALAALRCGGAQLLAGQRVLSLQPAPSSERSSWQLRTQEGEYALDDVILACSASEAARLLESVGDDGSQPADLARWIERARAMHYEPIATVYARTSQTLHWAGPMLALAGQGPAGTQAQFVFDRGRLGDAPGCLAFVVSACRASPAELEMAVMQQAQDELGLDDLQIIATVVEKRATFACTPGLLRPAPVVAPGLWAAGDYVDGPYPATLEGAVRSGKQVAQAVMSS